MNRYKIIFDTVDFRAGTSTSHLAEIVEYTGTSTDADSFQETIITMLEDMGAAPGNILSIKRI